MFNDIPSPEAKVIELLEHIKDLVAATQSIDDLATKERRNSSVSRNTLTPADAIHLQSVYSGIQHLAQDCIEVIEHFHPQWKMSSRSGTGSAILYGEVFRMLFSSIILLHINGTSGDEEANDLILKAAEEPSPWTKTLKDSASTICQALGFLPLALVHAGKAILLRLCSWDGYLAFFDRHTDRIRRDRSSSRDSRRIQEDDDSMNVFSSYEILYRSLEVSGHQKFEDAIELLQLFSYFHHQNIRVDVSVHAATNPLREEKAGVEQAKADEEIQRKIPDSVRKTWTTWLRELSIRLSRHLDSPPPLPAALRNTDCLTLAHLEDEVNDRLRIALVELVKRSLIMSQDRAQGRYCMHPLVHKWVRERAGMATSQQALWCQVSTTVLARSISFPPLGDTEFERDMRRELLPHIIHVRSCESDIRKRLQENRMRRRSLWPALYVEFGKHQALESTRFSRVYSECGLFKEALQLQSKVRSFAIQALGEGHPLAIRISLFQTGTLYELSRASEATRLQRRMYEVCLESLGQHQPLTLTVADMLASSLCFMGQYSASLSLHQKAVEGMTLIYGERHVDTLKAIRNLARVHLRYMEFSKSAELGLIAWEGMKEELGEAHVETLIALEDLAMTRIRLGKDYLPECHDQMDFVLKQREKVQGKEHPYTLLAICNLGRVKSAMGQPEDAARIMEQAVDIAERNLGENHYGVLAGKPHYAQVLVKLNQFEEAEEIFYTITGKPQYQQFTDDEGGEHRDRLIALWYLAGCLEKQGKFQKALETCQGLEQSLRDIGGKGLGTKHKFAAMVQEEIAKIQGLIKDKEEVSESDLTVPAEI
ncbi:TPR-like protein [Hypoxylon sp. FL1150]|nr:TPR-like protein [Hypoxylon sp. FL1150]